MVFVVNNRWNQREMIHLIGIKQIIGMKQIIGIKQKMIFDVPTSWNQRFKIRKTNQWKTNQWKPTSGINRNQPVESAV